MAAFRVIVVPYELGRLRDGTGRGPEALLDAGAAEALAVAGAAVAVETVEIDPRFAATGEGEVDAGFELIRAIAARVREARAAAAFPVVLAGSCFAGVGVVAGLAEAAPAVVWLDAHSDFNEPATAISGYFDGMGTAVLTGGAWQALLATVPGAAPLEEARLVLAGARDFEPPEVERLRASAVVQLPPERLRTPDALLAAVGGIAPPPSGVYLHLDLDVLDRDVAAVNVYAAGGGIDADELDALVDALLCAAPVRALSLTAYDPAFDRSGAVPPITCRVLETLARRASSPARTSGHSSARIE